MGIEFDPTKDAVDRHKHRLSLASAERMDFTAALYARDVRYYGEDRIQPLGLLDGRLHMLVFTMRGNKVRMISLRKANIREVKPL